MTGLRICTICARGGSKGVPGKNIRPMLGKPLITHSIEQAKATGLFALLAVSSDSPDILAAARAGGADMVIERPAEMASDTAGKLPAIAHAVREAERLSGLRFATLCDLDCTSPLRVPADIAACIRLVEDDAAGNVLTAAPARRSPYFNMLEQSPEGRVSLSKPLPHFVKRRQDAPAVYDMNASIYVWAREPFLTEPYVIDARTRLYVMPPERSHDIDEPLDFEIVEFLMQRQRNPA